MSRPENVEAESISDVGVVPWSVRTERIAIASFWIFIASLEVLRGLVNPFPHGRQISTVAYISLGTYAVWGLITPAIFALSRRLPIDRNTAVHRLTIFLGIGLGVSILVGFIQFGLIKHLVDLSNVTLGDGETPIRFSWSDVILRLWFLDELMIFVAVLAVGLARSYFIRMRVRERESVEFKAEAAHLQSQLSDARLSALQMQLNPHFLFNTLHSVSSMADENPAGVQTVVARLSALLRRTFEGSGRQEVPLSEELSFLRDYLEIQRIRFQGRLQVLEDIGEGTRDALVPSLILQPIVENAVKFTSDEASDGEGRIDLRARREGSRLLLTVRDNGPGLSAGASANGRSGGVGLANTRARLDVLYGDEAALRLENAPTGGLIVTIEIPFHTSTAERLTAAI